MIYYRRNKNLNINYAKPKKIENHFKQTVFKAINICRALSSFGFNIRVICTEINMINT